MIRAIETDELDVWGEESGFPWVAVAGRCLRLGLLAYGLSRILRLRGAASLSQGEDQ